MFNSSVRREAIEKLEKSVKRHESIGKSVECASERLFKQRQCAAGEVIERVEDYVNRLANSPKEFDKSVAQYRIEVNRFDKTVQRLEVEAIEATSIASATGTSGAIAGAGVATLGPTAAMAVATTFGTASTGTAIAALSGAAAKSAALAWLGGGAIAAGGGGVAAGKVLLALTGPVGWAIGGLAVAGSAAYLNTRNKNIAEEATQERVKVEAEVRSLKTANREIEGLGQRTEEHSKGCLAELDWLTNHAPKNYRQFNLEQKERLAALINHIRSLSQLLKAEVAL
ncbi:MAG: hypothetical protein OXI58_03455 [Gemmatimonadota bacterium]|nr:hypothetical protein [Gemmatimonadota bacterium]